PSYWKKEQWLEKIKEREWLVLEKDGIGCGVCKSVGTLGPLKSQGLKLSREWTECKVSCFGDTDEKKRQSMRKKIFDHKSSIAHKRSLEICAAAKKEQFEKAIANQESAYKENTCRVFRTVYTLAKLNRPFSDLPVVLDLQKANGLDSDHSCADITCHIAKSMRRKLVESVISNDLKIGFMIDESTTASKKAALVICMKVVFTNSDEASSMFFDLVQLADTTASTIHDTFLQALYDNGFTQEFLLRNFVSFATNGASNMLGRKSGVATLLLGMFPNVIVWHCSNHRLELAVADVVEEVSETYKMKSFFDKLYSLYSASPKKQAELQECASALCIWLNAIGRILGTRWVSSSARSVRAVWQNNAALVQHFENASTDTSRDSKQRATYKGLKNRLTDTSFVLNMGLLFDALVELKELSLELQKRSTTLMHAHKLVEQKCLVFESMSQNPGEHFLISQQAVRDAAFKGVALHKGRMTAINRTKFFSCLLMKMEERIFNKLTYQELLKHMEVLDKSKWPCNPDICFGDKSIRHLCAFFNISQVQRVVSGFRGYLSDTSDEDNKVPERLKQLLDVLKTLIISTAECERSFSALNDILTNIRNSLSLETASKLIFIKTVGPPLELFKPESYVRSWLGKGRHHADFNTCRSRQTDKKKSNHPAGMKSVWELL
uniref:HAT C-terminal dimerisation domain-containing protein n=1 Tax=Latimeria chalumnae TaxID=7897 RepID=H3AKH7_LATCH